MFGFMSNDEKKKQDNLRFFYEKAIEGRNFHYRSYMTYMNLYAIFTGALFVALYTILTAKGEGGNLDVLKFAVMALGLITSLCWLGSIKGYYHWLISWLAVVDYYEKQLNSGKCANDANLVYSLHYEASGSKKKFLSGAPFSTQKLTIFFVTMVALGWFFMLVHSIGVFKILVLKNILIVLGLVFVFLLILKVFEMFGLKFFNSDLSTHYDVIKQGKRTEDFRIINEYEIGKPKGASK